MAFSAGPYAIGPSPFSSLGLGVKQVRNEIWMNSICLVCTAVHHPPSPTTSLPNRIPTPTATTGKPAAGPVQDGKESTYSTAAPSSCACLAPSTSISSTTRGDQGRPSSVSSGTGPHHTCWPIYSSQMCGGGTPSSSFPHVSRSSPCKKDPSSSNIIFYGIGSSYRGGITKTV